MSAMVLTYLVGMMTMTPSSALSIGSRSEVHGVHAVQQSSKRVLTAGDHTLTIVVGNRKRTLILHVPPARQAAHRGLILVFHGALATAASTAAATDFEQVSDRKGELVAFLQGYANTWNEGTGNTPARQAHVNDVAFVNAALTKLESMVAIDRNRIAAVGLSNGALLVEDLGCHLAQRLALIVPVEGELPVSFSSTCTPVRPVSVFEIHGTADALIPYNGGPFVGVGGGTIVELSAPASAARWAALDGCSPNGTASSPSSDLRVTSYSACRSGVSVTLHTIVGGVHEWPVDVGALTTQALYSPD